MKMDQKMLLNVWIYCHFAKKDDPIIRRIHMKFRKSTLSVLQIRDNRDKIGKSFLIFSIKASVVIPHRDGSIEGSQHVFVEK